MRKWMLIWITACMLLPITVFAEDLTLLPGEATVNYGFSINADGSGDIIYAEDYIVFENITVPKGTKSVIITAGSENHNHNDGDIFHIKKDNQNGELLSKVIVEVTPGGKADKIEFFGAFTGESGTYNIALKSICGKNYIKVWSIRFSDTPVPKEEPYIPTPVEGLCDLGATTWAAVDDVGRAMPDIADAGEQKDRTVGMFFWTWGGSRQGVIYDNTKILAANPGCDVEYPTNVWGGYGTTHYWAEPLWGYYLPDDRWVLRRQIAMLSAAGVDVLFTDCTNGSYLWKEDLKALLEELHAMREEGLDTPQVSIICNFAALPTTKIALYMLYESWLSKGIYSDLWFQWEGKPLVMAYPDSLNDSDPYFHEELLKIKEFFTFREPQANYTGGGKGTQWGWLEVYPQNRYNYKDGMTEQMTVGVAQNHNYVQHKIAPLNFEFATSRSYTHTWGMDYSEDACKYGYNFREQWMRALDEDPKFIFITGWNEWTAGFHENWVGYDNAFPDQFDMESSRDIEPVKGGFGDNYYYQLVMNVRRYKGVEKTPTAGAEITVKAMADARKAEPVFYDNNGDTIARNHEGRQSGTVFTDNTGRNDIIEARVARDSEKLYFYVKCAENITAPDDSAWMRLYINADRRKVTGWEGYDFMLQNETVYAIKGTAWQTEKIGEAKVRRSGTEMYITVERSLLGLAGVLDFEFKWQDNAQTEGDIMDWYVSGDAAPLGRFNYVFKETETKTLSAKEREMIEDVLAIKIGSSVAYLGGARRSLVDSDPTIAAFKENKKVYIPAEILPDYLNCKLDFEPKKNQLVIMCEKKTLRIVENADTAYLNGAAKASEGALLIKDGKCYVSIEELCALLQMKLTEQEGVYLIGEYSTLPTLYFE